jgi:hypothetical protein
MSAWRSALLGILASVLAGCSGVGGKPLSTASTTPVVVDNNQTRLSQVAWTAARAAKCGFVIDQARLKSNYIAYEATASEPAALATVEKAYDAVHSVMEKKIAPQSDYCSTAVVDEVRSDLARYLAGNFAARAVKPTSDAG